MRNTIANMELAIVSLKKGYAIEITFINAKNIRKHNMFEKDPISRFPTKPLQFDFITMSYYTVLLNVHHFIILVYV